MIDTLKAIIVDDEEGARSVLSNLIKNFCPDIRVLESFSNVKDAVVGIKNLQPDLVFLDIEMPHYAGHEIVSFFDQIDFEIIFVTAYDSYAVKAFEVAAVDYLLKPVDIDRLKLAVEKSKEKIQTKRDCINYQILQDSLKTNEITNLVIAAKGDQNIVPVDCIIAIEAQESYSCIHTTFKKFIASKNLKHFETLLLDNANFFRSHKSWIVNLNLLERYSKSNGQLFLSENIIAKLSKYRKDAFEKEIVKV